ncbi:alpha/beta fold hydrolase [Gordonia desulfuricans]|uniref:Alpha/beta fold hydrolase n=1 Tax=Gordonia desulfuricans TaxID=89051 RepID=A0A7K3LKZ2_9ACTN|nr:alpha/beta hydrolase [Gordonia desulfuricans]NDK88711.1 alpha/beta fold hydrolase [Gordonia desulfuricans]
MSSTAKDRISRALRVDGLYADVRDLPAGSMVELPGRGTTFVTDSGPAEAPAIFLQHSVMTTGLLCWYPVIPELNKRYRVVTLDHRWHGRGIRSDRFDLRDCADDAVALADQLGIDRFVTAGFSMGGGISQLVWKRHRERVGGLVLCSTGPFFSTNDPHLREQANRTGRFLKPVYKVIPRPSDASLDKPSSTTMVWGMKQFLSTPLSHTGDFGEGLGRFDSRPWLGEIDVPTSVVVSTRDRVVDPDRQQLLVDGIAGAQRFEVDGGHACCVIGADKFVPPFLEAVDSVVRAADLTAPPRLIVP